MSTILLACSKDTQSETVNPEPSIPAPDGWVYYGGDEFNEAAFDHQKWLAYGTEGSYTANYGRPQGMIQTYRPEQIEITTTSSGEKVVQIISEKRTDGNSIHNETGWWSGAIGSRERNVYYPLFCRIDVRAKIVNDKGFWHGVWSRHYKGASTAELDLNETFVIENGKNVVSQAIHLWNSDEGKTQINIPKGQDRRMKVERPGELFHIYSVQIERIEGKPLEARITYLIDDVVNYSFRTDQFGDNIYNKFIIDAVNEKRENTTWDVIFTGGVGGVGGIGYPEDNFTKVISEIDYVRVFTKK